MELTLFLTAFLNILFNAFGKNKVLFALKKVMVKEFSLADFDEISKTLAESDACEGLGDKDKDGIPDMLDKCPEDPACGDADKDGVPDLVDKCPEDPNCQ